MAPSWGRLTPVGMAMPSGGRGASAWVYLLECGDGSIYAGATLDLERRVAAHRTGKGGRYTASHQPVRLVFAAECSTLGEAMRLEAQIKQRKRNQKLALVRAWQPHETFIRLSLTSSENTIETGLDL